MGKDRLLWFFLTNVALVTLGAFGHRCEQNGFQVARFVGRRRNINKAGLYITNSELEETVEANPRNDT